MRAGVALALGMVMASMAAGAGPEADLDVVDVAACMPGAGDYTHSWHPNPVINPFAGEAHREKPQLLCFRTGHFGMALELLTGDIVRLGPLDDPASYAAAAEEDAGPVLALPEARLVLTVLADGKEYTCARTALESTEWNRANSGDYPVRMIDSGRVFQRYDLLGLEFEDETGNRLPALGRLEIGVWPDCMSLALEITPEGDGKPDWGLETRFKQGASWSTSRSEKGGLASGILQTFAPCPVPSVTATDLADDAAVAVTYEAERGWHRVALPGHGWSAAEDLDHLERVRVRIENPDDREAVARLFFDKDMTGLQGLTGMTPMIRDLEGNPTGIPVQLSKNWHRREDQCPIHQGPWFHGFSVLRVPPRSATEFEFALTYARWGRVPAASHAQLCLVGWGWNVLWHQVAIGSWGEQICYQVVDPACVIEDVRPVLVRGMRTEHPLWSWTSNVGGGDFLRYTVGLAHQTMARTRVILRSHGPNLTDVDYLYDIGDRAVDVRLNVQTARCDDYARHFHRFRYEVRKPIAFDDLVFYSMGSDHYGVSHEIGCIATGNADGLGKTFDPGDMAGPGPYRNVFPSKGPVPWIALTGSVARPPGGEPVLFPANRGLIIREWKARIGGEDVGTPHAAYRDAGKRKEPHVVVDLVAPPGCDALEPGDFVEAAVEFVVLPKQAGDYYGPNEALRAALEEHGDSWRMVHREAVGNDLRVEALRGEVRRAYPIEVAVDGEQRAEVEVTGGMGYVPITFTGLTGHAGYVLSETVDGQTRRIDQSVHGNDFGQVEYDGVNGRWRHTYNVDFDACGEAPSQCVCGSRRNRRVRLSARPHGREWCLW